MNSRQLVGKTILLGSLGLAMVLFGAASSKAQEVSPDHFTDTGVQNVHENAPAGPVKATVPTRAQKQLSSQSHNRPGALRVNRKRHVRTATRVVTQSHH